MTLRTLRSEALKLSTEERAKLATGLRASLDSANEPELDAAWAKEADRRFRAYRRGEIQAIPAEQALAEAKAHVR
jgi:putative addiction module component (TIGR02574 family)